MKSESETQGEPKSNGNRKSKDPRRTLNQILSDHRSTAGGGFALRRAYLGDRLHRGSSVWLRVIQPRHTEWAIFLGSEKLEDLRPDLRETVRLWMADYLLIAYHVPHSESASTVKEIRAAMNGMARLTRVLEEHRAQKGASDLPAMCAKVNV
jgi:hypothetical protein